MLECIEAFPAVSAQSHKLSQRIHSLIVAEIDLSGKIVCQAVLHTATSSSLAVELEIAVEMSHFFDFHQLSLTTLQHHSVLPN